MATSILHNTDSLLPSADGWTLNAKEIATSDLTTGTYEYFCKGDGILVVDSQGSGTYLGYGQMNIPGAFAPYIIPIRKGLTVNTWNGHTISAEAYYWNKK